MFEHYFELSVMIKAGGVMVKALDCGIVLSEFEIQSHYYVHFRTYTLGRGINPLIFLSVG